MTANHPGAFMIPNDVRMHVLKKSFFDIVVYYITEGLSYCIDVLDWIIFCFTRLSFLSWSPSILKTYDIDIVHYYINVLYIQWLTAMDWARLSFHQVFVCILVSFNAVE